MPNIDDTLKERGEVYGDYEGGCKLRSDMLSLIAQRYRQCRGKEMSSMDLLLIFDIVNKLSRLAVTPSHVDTWHDIAGYATLTKTYILTRKGKENADK